MESWGTTLAEIDAAHAATDQMWHEFLRVPDLSVGLYVIPAGEDDPQSPHHEDEVYYILAGRGTLRVGDREFPAETGSILYVSREVPHHFHDVTEELRVLVFFAPAHTD